MGNLTAAARDRFSIVCLSPQEWRAALPTNRQQVMRRAAERGHPVLFVETGRFLGVHLWLLVRGPERRSLARRLVTGEEVAAGVRVRKALNILPWGQRYRLSNRVNTAFTAALLRRLARRLPRPVALWNYDPCLAGVAGRCGENVAVYDCVDDYPEQVGTDPRRRALVAAGDERAAALAQVVFTTTTPLFERHRRVNPRTHLVRNAGDYRHFAAAADPSLAASELASLPRPVLGFSGNLKATKVDLALVESAARARPGWTFLLIGPAGAELRTPLERLVTLPNVHWLGPKPYDELPRYVAAFDVALIPYVANAYTRSCFPLKLYEYLAAGKPVVASGLPELAGMAPDVVLVEGADALLAAVEAALRLRGSDDRARRMAVAAASSWEERTERLLGLVAGELRIAARTGS